VGEVYPNRPAERSIILKNQHMKKRTIISTGATPKTLRLNFEKVVVGENPKNKTGFSYALFPKETEFSIELYRLVHAFPELPQSLLVYVQNLSGQMYPIAVISSDSDLRSSVLKHSVSNAAWCFTKLKDFQSTTLVFQPAKVG
jgi:hypothetical protein